MHGKHHSKQYTKHHSKQYTRQHAKHMCTASSTPSICTACTARASIQARTREGPANLKQPTGSRGFQLQASSAQGAGKFSPRSRQVQPKEKVSSAQGAGKFSPRRR